MQYTIVDDDVEVAPIYTDTMARLYHLQSWPGYRAFTYMARELM